VVIVSKTYCPFSKRAKQILLEKYHIVPAPYVLEVDEHAHGDLIQDYLLDSTGRRTVPNILISGTSIGGSDEVAALDESDALIDTIQKKGGQTIEKVTKVL
jgi:glutaredoxin